MVTYFFEHERLVSVHGVDTVVRYYACAKFLPDRICRQPVHFDVYVGADPFVGEHLTRNDVNGQRASDNTVHGGFGERVKCAVGAPHELRLQQITAAHVIFEYAQVQLHGYVHCLVVECHQLTSRVPEHLRHEVGRVKARAGRVHSAQLVFIVFHELHRSFFQQRHGLFLIEG